MKLVRNLKGNIRKFHNVLIQFAVYTVLRALQLIF